MMITHAFITLSLTITSTFDNENQNQEMPSTAQQMLSQLQNSYASLTETQRQQVSLSDTGTRAAICAAISHLAATENFDANNIDQNLIFAPANEEARWFRDLSINSFKRLSQNSSRDFLTSRINSQSLIEEFSNFSNFDEEDLHTFYAGMRFTQITTLEIDSIQIAALNTASHSEASQFKSELLASSSCQEWRARIASYSDDHDTNRD